MATNPPSSDTVDVLPFVLLHQVQRDVAIGLARAGERVLALLDYRRQQEREMSKSLAGAAFYKAIIDECQRDIKQLLSVADTPDKRRAILDRVQELYALAEKAAAELEKMTYAG